MRRALALCATAAVALGACDRERGTPTIKPMPTPDGVAALPTPGARSPRIANYRIVATFDAQAMTVRASQRLTWRNAGATAVDRLPFHLYMNAFADDESVFMKASRGQHRRAEADPDARGSIEVTAIRVDGGADVRGLASFPGPDRTVLEVPLAAPLAPGATVAVDMEFEVQLPAVFARTGYSGAFAMVGQWFPKIGVRVPDGDGERWHCEPFHLHSEFFADFGVYDVELTVPETHVVAATGVLTAATDRGDGTRTLTFRAEDVHDFAWMADPYMEIVRATAATAAGPVEVRVYHRPAQRAFAARHLRAGVRAVELFSELLVPYPYPIMSIIDPPPAAAEGAGGMEYPTLVTTAGDGWFAGDTMLLPEVITVHEVGHNWFQGIIASNEVEEAWLDEGVNEYLDGVVMERAYGPAALAWGGFAIDYYAMRRAVTTWPVTPIATPSYAFPSFAAYGDASYTKTALALRTLEHLVGSERFLAALRAYAQRWAFRHPTGDDFFAALQQQLGEDLEWFIEPAFRRGGYADFRVEDIDCAGDGCEVLVANRGSVLVPVDVDVRFADGHVERVRWDDRSAWRELRFERDADVVTVEIDPQRRVLLDRSPLRNGLRAAPERAAARRAGARAQFWTQTLMQVTGL